MYDLLPVAQQLDYKDYGASLQASNFNPLYPTKFVIHGFTQDERELWLHTMKDALLTTVSVSLSVATSPPLNIINAVIAIAAVSVFVLLFILLLLLIFVTVVVAVVVVVTVVGTSERKDNVVVGSVVFVFVVVVVVGTSERSDSGVG